MSDNVVLNPGVGGAVVSTQDDGTGVQLPRSLLIVGPQDGGDVSATNPLPIYNQVTPIVQPGYVTLVNSAIETTICTFTVTGTCYVSAVTATGDLPGEFKLYCDNILQLTGRTSVASPTYTFYFGLATPKAITAVKLTVQHFQATLHGAFNGTILGTQK